MKNYDLIIEAGKTERHYWKDLWKFRELLGFLSWRDIIVRYKQTVIGVAWSLIRPILTMIVFTIIFGNIAKLPSEGYPYPIMVFAAMLPWQFFSNSFSSVANSLIGNSNLVTKIYFPRIVIPLSTALTSFVDFLISFVIYIGLMVYYKVPFSFRILTLPGLLLLTFFTSMAFGLLFCALNVKYRDFKYIIPFIVQFGLYISPVGFSSSIVPEAWKFLYSLNPMVGVIDGFRWALLGGNTSLYIPGFFLSIVITLIFFIIGLFYFRKTERTFADII